jgi:hypothetical protein
MIVTVGRASLDDFEPLEHEGPEHMLPMVAECKGVYPAVRGGPPFNVWGQGHTVDEAVGNALIRADHILAECQLPGGFREAGEIILGMVALGGGIPDVRVCRID